MLNNTFLDISDEKRGELIKQLVSFVPTDTLLFLPDTEEVNNALSQINSLLNTAYKRANGLKIPSCNLEQKAKLLEYFGGASSREVAFVFLAGKELSSVLLAILLNEKVFDIEQVFALSFYEELCQQKEWGVTDEIAKRHAQIMERLKELEELND